MDYREAKRIGREYGFPKSGQWLLSPPDANPKIAKSNKAGEYLSCILHLAPGNLSGFEVCPWRTAGCTDDCLGITAGRAGIPLRSGTRNPIIIARIRRTRFYFEHREAFLAILRREIELFCNKAKRLGLKPAIRLNGTSDLSWTDTIRQFPNVQFYDYTKSVKRMLGAKPANYYLIFSRSENNDNDCSKVLAHGGNVAVVFETDEFPNEFLGHKVIGGDDTDERFLDPEEGCVIGLRLKVWNGAHDTVRDRGLESGFVVPTIAAFAV